MPKDVLPSVCFTDDLTIFRANYQYIVKLVKKNDI